MADSARSYIVTAIAVVIGGIIFMSPKVGTTTPAAATAATRPSTQAPIPDDQAPAQRITQVQIIRPGDFPDTAVENTLRKKCEGEWRDDFRMRVYCEKQQREAARTLTEGSPQDVPSDKASVVRSKCAADWPDDYRMRVYCEKQQYTAFRELGRR
ncbi:hypothetical protein [Bradyrhizobium niftali]|uniref:Uncharacterized protein n=1 Tax=Bradyrhizobium niftali TaxID=2560055 RepID=A0A4Y9LDE3_9BRAD|nr:hypothetical protein [Bradyrhizobium niftali]TFV41365.1 hypothetical protein E4K65_36350 [Bradyrhizobium niftali]